MESEFGILIKGNKNEFLRDCEKLSVSSKHSRSVKNKTQEPTMAKDKLPPHNVEMTESKREIIKDLLSE